MVPAALGANNREKYNFNSQWLLHVGDIQGAEKNSFSDKDWKKVTLPHAFNEDEAFKVGIENMTDTVSWYRKHFKLPKTAKGKKVFIEFEGVRQGADFYVNGNHIGRVSYTHLTLPTIYSVEYFGEVTQFKKKKK